MLLETLEVKKNDVIIYSQNKFDFKDNFKIIFKNEKIKHPRTIDYFEVCEFIKDPAPKNLIVYRLLTNVSKLDAYSTKYGYFIKVRDNMELIYFDPVFAIKDLRHLKFDLDPENFRFKIQQVGYTSLMSKDYETSYNEVFSINMRAAEAQNQNDKIFAEAIYAFDENFIDQEELLHSSSKINNELLEDYKESSGHNLNNISEEKLIVRKHLEKAEFEEAVNTLSVREKKIEALKIALGIQEEVRKEIKENKGRAFSAFINQHRVREEKEININLDKQNMIDLFKSSSKLKTDEDDEKDSFLLKFNK
ncbi:MAG: hypothetical protein KJ571_18660 [Bacteroidetes bacterium]|nr:hypothetical protein [Bacteroidota bacterium]